MMGLSYECEPVFRRLETHFGESLRFKYAMGLLVPDVYQLVNPADLAYGHKEAIERYNVRLARIYENEEPIGGMPINMQGFCLFDEEHTSTLPLNLAFKAVERIAPDKAERFLYNLRYATIVECRPTTRIDEILRVVRFTGIDRDEFLTAYHSKSTERHLMEDLRTMASYGIRSLPTCVIEYNGREVLVSSLIGYDAFVSVIDELTRSAVKPQAPEVSLDSIRSLLRRHPLISPIELREAFNFALVSDVLRFIQPLVETSEIEIIQVYHGQCINYKQKSNENDI